MMKLLGFDAGKGTHMWKWCTLVGFMMVHEHFRNVNNFQNDHNWAGNLVLAPNSTVVALDDILIEVMSSSRWHNVTEKYTSHILSSQMYIWPCTYICYIYQYYIYIYWRIYRTWLCDFCEGWRSQRNNRGPAKRSSARMTKVGEWRPCYKSMDANCHGVWNLTHGWRNPYTIIAIVG